MFELCARMSGVAGGLGKRGIWGSMTERVAASAAPVPPPMKHCYVTDVHGQLPALLLEWRQTESGWQGRVVRPVLDGNAWVVVEEWLPAGLLDPT